MLGGQWSRFVVQVFVIGNSIVTVARSRHWQHYHANEATLAMIVLIASDRVCKRHARFASLLRDCVDQQVGRDIICAARHKRISDHFALATTINEPLPSRLLLRALR
jgi:hypothetical protein